MTEKTIDNIRSQSLLSINIQPNKTNAALVDSVENRYRFMATGSTNTSSTALIEDAFYGVQEAIGKLSTITMRDLLRNDGQLITPNQSDGSGVDQFTATISPLKPLKVALMGLLDNVSLESARKLARSTYTQIVETFSLYHTKTIEQQLDDIVRHNPDVIIVTGGTDGGAQKPILKSLETLKIILNLFPEGKRPEVLYVGNADLAEKAVEMIESIAPIYTSQNLRPTLEDENLGPAEKRFIDIMNAHFHRSINGIADLQEWSNGNIFPNSYALGRATRLFSKIISENKPRSVLSVHFGSNSTIIASSYDSLLDLHTMTGFGSRIGFNDVFKQEHIQRIQSWVPFPVSEDKVNDYLNNLVLHPTTVSTTQSESSLDNSIYREVFNHAVMSVDNNFNQKIGSISPDFLPLFDLIIVGGDTINNIPEISTNLMNILNAIQPVGFQQIILDKNNLMSLLGSAMRINPDLVSQLILDPIAFSNLGFVISPVSLARAGTPILRVRIAYETGHENTIIFKKGNIYKIPLPVGQKAKILMEPLNRADLGRGPGKLLPSKMVVGGPFGLVVDARGRPINLPKKAEERYATLLGWNKNLA
jgi:hypothetical protein